MDNNYLQALMGNLNVDRNNTPEGSTTTLSNGNNRLGFVSNEMRDGGRRYGIGIDNVGSPYRGVLDKKINLPIGTIDYGYDGDTVAAGITPNNYYIQALANLLRGR